jgi:tetratricopeptide (TPR) repeat protein
MDSDRDAARAAITDARRRQPVLTRELAEAYLERYPDDSVVWACYGDALSSMGCFSKARVALQRALGLAASTNERTTALRMHARLCEETGDYAGAEQLHRRAIESAPGKGTWWLYLGTALRRQERDSEAEQCFRRALELEGARDEFWLNLGYVLQAREAYEEALACFREALKLDPEYEEAKLGISELEAVLRAREGERSGT